MKKTLVLISLFLIVAVGVYAVSNTVNLNGYVPESYDVLLDLGHSLTSYDGPFDYDTNPLTDLNLSSDGTVFFSIANSNPINLGEDKTGFRVDISATDWVKANLNGLPAANETLPLTISHIGTLFPIANVLASAISMSGAQPYLTIQYLAGITEAGEDIAHFRTSWVGNDMLSVGDYSSTVTIAYTVD